MQPRLATLFAYLPQDRRRAIIEGAELPARSLGAVLFADISGWTPLAEALAEALGSRRGVEELARAINQVYGVLIGEVERFGGSVISFAGDALTCWFAGAARDAGGRAAACALAMQAAIAGHASRAAWAQAPLAMKAAVAVGPASRFVVGDPAIQLIDVLAGATLDRAVAAEQAAGPGEVVADEPTAAALAPRIQVADWRTGQDGAVIAVIAGIAAPAPAAPGPPATPEATDAPLESWVLRSIYEQIEHGQGEFLTELRPAVALFLHFQGIDYDTDHAAAAQLDGYVRWVQGVLEHFDGTLIKLVTGDKGSYIYAAFGAPIAHEDDIERAVAAADQLRRPPDSFGAIGGLGIGLSQGTMRTGVYGSPTRRTYDVLGDQANVAARLMQLAAREPLGRRCRVLATAGCAAATFRWQGLSTLPIKGKSAPIAVFELLDEHSARPDAPNAGAPAAAPLIGREQELAALVAAFDQIQRGAGAIIGISAAAGMGKSRLIDELLRRTEAPGQPRPRIYRSESQSYASRTPYGLWTPIWRGLFGLEDRQPPEEQIAQVERALAAIHPLLPPRAPLLGPILRLPFADTPLTAGLDPAMRKASGEALLAVCLKALAAQPTLLVLENIHWSDGLSLEALAGLARVIASRPILTILTYRPDAEHAERLGPIRGLGSELELGELSPGETERFIRNKLALNGRTLPPAALAALLERVGQLGQGTPFYLEELLDLLIDTGLEAGDPAAIHDLALPTGLQSLILSRLDQLSEPHHALLKVASIMGRSLPLDWLAAYYPQLGPAALIRSDLEWLAGYGWLERDPAGGDTYRFKHQITQEAIYGSLAYEFRETFHEHFARFLEARLAPEEAVELLAYHYERSANLAKKRAYLSLAAKRASAAFALETAIQLYERLRGLADEPRDMLAALNQLSGLLYFSGRWKEAEARRRQALEIARQLADPLAEAAVQAELGALLRDRGMYAEAWTWLRQAEALARAANAPDTLAKILPIQGDLARRQGDYALAGRLLQECLPLVGANQAAQAELRSQLIMIALDGGDTATVRRLAAENLADFRALGNKQALAATFNNLGLAAQRENDQAAAQRYHGESLAILREIGIPYNVATALMNAGVMAYGRGDYGAAQALQEEALAIRLELDDRPGIAASYNQLATVALAQGELDTAHRLQSASLIQTHELGEKVRFGYGLNLAAAIALEQGRRSASRALLERAARLLGATAAILAEMGVVIGPIAGRIHEGTLAALRELLGPPDLAAAQAAGAALTAEQALAEALRDLDER